MKNLETLNAYKQIFIPAAVPYPPYSAYHTIILFEIFPDTRRAVAPEKCNDPEGTDHGPRFDVSSIFPDQSHPESKLVCTCFLCFFAHCFACFCRRENFPAAIRDLYGIIIPLSHQADQSDE